jgi:hypothetical protein
MTVQTDLQTVLDAYIQSNFLGSLEEVSADQLPLQNLLKLQSYLADSGGGGGGGGGGSGGGAHKATTAPTTSVASSTSSVTLLALNTNRKWAAFRNDSTSVAYIAKSGTASTSSVYRLEPQGYQYFDDYTGIVTGIWASVNGFMRIEEGT